MMNYPLRSNEILAHRRYVPQEPWNPYSRAEGNAPIVL